MKSFITIVLLILSINLYGAQTGIKSDSTLKIWILKEGGKSYDSYRVHIGENGFTLKFLWLSNLVTLRWNERIQEYISYDDMERFERRDIGKEKMDIYHMIFYVDSNRLEIKWENRKQRDKFLKLLGSVIPSKLQGTGLKQD